MFFRSILLFLFVGIRIILFANSLHQSSEYLLNAISSILDNKFSPNIRRIKERDTTGSLADSTDQGTTGFPDDYSSQDSDNLPDSSYSISDCNADPKIRRIKERDTTGSLKDPANQDPISFPGNSMNQGLDLGLKINSILINFTDDEFHRVKPR